MTETNLARLRKQAGITQVQLAEITGITQSRISAYEIGQRDIGMASLKIAAKIAAALGVHAEELLDDDEKAAP